MSAKQTRRLSASPWDLVRQTMGGPKEIAHKARNLAHCIYGYYGREDKVYTRLQRLQELGHIDTIPNRVQRIVGAVDMVRFFIVPAAADYYDEKGINFRFHTLLRVFDDPASLFDPTGFNSTRDAIIGHVMQVVHANAHYDFELLDSFPDGMAEMERQVRAVLDGSHPRTESILAIVEEPDYHERLLQYVIDYRQNPGAPPLVRTNVAARFRDEERTFGTISAAMRYFSRMPATLPDAIAHLATVRTFPRELAEPERAPPQPAATAA